MKIFISRRIPSPALDRIRAACASLNAKVDIWQGDDPPPYDQLSARVQGIAGLLCMLTDRVDAALMDAAGPSLKVISQMAVGYDNIDTTAAAVRGIPIGNTPGVLTEATADLTMTLLLAAARRIPESMAYIREGHWKTWKPMELLGRDLNGATLGIIGFGRIGQAVAARARAFGMHILAYSRSLTPEAAGSQGAEYAPLPDLLHRADFVSVHTPLNTETRHLINRETLAQMKLDSILINTARGGVVDSAALYEALRAGVIAGAALDVTDPEPIPLTDPLLSLPNVLIVPHIGSATLGTRTKMALMAADNLIAGLRGEPLPNAVQKR
ncbi:MAG: D-glycerate dehydrogenase [Anaerolineae bacterium]